MAIDEYAKKQYQKLKIKKMRTALENLSDHLAVFNVDLASKLLSRQAAPARRPAEMLKNSVARPVPSGLCSVTFTNDCELNYIDGAMENFMKHIWQRIRPDDAGKNLASSAVFDKF